MYRNAVNKIAMIFSAGKPGLRKRAACGCLLMVLVLVGGCATYQSPDRSEAGRDAGTELPLPQPEAHAADAVEHEEPSPDSREYKILLSRAQFEDRNSGAINFWQLVEQEAQGLMLDVSSTDPDEKGRRIRFLDTTEFALADKFGFVFRERINLKDDGTLKKSKKVTLKYRGPDKMLAENLNLLSGQGEDAEQKLEVDAGIKSPTEPAVLRKLSKSGTTKLPGDQAFEVVGDILDSFPAAAGQLAGIEDQALAVVNSYAAREVKRKAGTIMLAEGCEAGASFSFWYNWTDQQVLDVAEFSYDYDMDGPCTNAEVDARAVKLLTALGAVEGWIDPAQTSKTRFVYTKTGAD